MNGSPEAGLPSFHVGWVSVGPLVLDEAIEADLGVSRVLKIDGQRV